MTSLRPYPIGLDTVWLASDESGHLGAFMTGGSGPIPARALAEGAVAVEDVEERLLRLPKIGDAKLLVEIPRPDSLLDLAQRGTFVFDWWDVHRVRRDRVGKYEAVAVPTRPITAAALPPELELEALLVPLPVPDFSANSRIDVRDLVNCIDGTAP